MSSRQFVVESLMLASAGALGGVVVAGVLLTAPRRSCPTRRVFFRTAISPGTQRIAGAAGLTRVGASMIGFDALTLAFTVGLTLLTAVLVSVLPAFQASTLRPLAVLKVAGGNSSARGFGRFGSRAILVGTEIAIALVLLAGAGLMLKSANRLQHTSIGVDPTNVLSAQFDLPCVRYDAQTGPLFGRRSSTAFARFPASSRPAGVSACRSPEAATAR